MTKKPPRPKDEDDLRPEYDFSKMKLIGRGIYAKRFRSGTNLALLDRDVREAFSDDRSVNEALRVITKAAKQLKLKGKKRGIQLEFWTAFKKYMEDKSKIRCQKPAPQSWMNHSIGRNGFWLCSVASTYSSETRKYDDHEIRVEFVMGDSESNSYFVGLEAQRAEIETEIGQSLTWHNPLGTKSCKIYLRQSENFLDRSQWPRQHEWLRENLEKFYRVFGLRARQLDSPKGLSPTQL